MTTERHDWIRRSIIPGIQAEPTIEGPFSDAEVLEALGAEQIKIAQAVAFVENGEYWILPVEADDE